MDDIKYTLADCLNVFDTLEVEYDFSAIRYLALKGTSIERIILKPDSNTMALLLIAGTEGHDEKLARAHYRNWILSHKFSINSFIACAIYRLWDTWGFFLDETTKVVMNDISEKMDSHIAIMNLIVKTQEEELKMSQYMESLSKVSQ